MSLLKTELYLTQTVIVFAELNYTGFYTHARPANELLYAAESLALLKCFNAVLNICKRVIARVPLYVPNIYVILLSFDGFKMHSRT